MRLLIIDQCSGSKKHPDWFDPLEAVEIDAHSRRELLERDQIPSYPARDLYTGRQQQYIDSAVDRLREAGDTVDRYFISAGFGFVDEQTELPPYEVTFKDYDSDGIRERAEALEIEADLLECLDRQPEYDAVVLALGSDYYEAVDIDRLLDVIPESSVVVLFNREADAEGHSNVVSIPARIEEAKRQGAMVVALKGHYVKQFAANRSNGAKMETPSDILEACTSAPMEQSGLDTYEDPDGE